MPFTYFKDPTTPSYGSVNREFLYDHTVDVETNISRMQGVFEPYPLSNDEMEQVLIQVTSQYSLDQVFRSEREREECHARSLQAREVMSRDIVLRKKADAELAQNHENAGALGRRLAFLRLDETEEAKQFNEQLLAASQNAYAPGSTEQDRAALGTMLFNEIERCRQAIGVNSPADVDALLDLDDQTVVDRFAELSHYTRLIAEVEAESNKGVFSEEQLKALKPYIGVVSDLAQVLESKLDMIANPYYERMDPSRFFGSREAGDGIMLTEALSDALNERPGFDQDKLDRQLDFDPLVSFFTVISNYNMRRVPTLYERAVREHPGLRTADLSVENVVTALGMMKPLIARTRDGEDLVIHNTVPNLTVQTGRDYAGQLSDLAAQADRWLLTGSQQFADMQKALREMQQAQNDNLTREEMLEHSNRLMQAAQIYLEYKGHKDGVLNRGKNRREQSRLDVAWNIFEFAQAQASALNNSIQREVREAEQAKRAAESAQMLDYQPRRVNALFENMTNAMPYGPSGAKRLPLSREDAALIAALACGSPDLSCIRELPVKGDQLSKVRIKNKPDQVYPDVMHDLLFPPEQAAGGANLANDMANAARAAVETEIEGGKYEALGKYVADGLKQNNQLLKNQKNLDDEFSAYARFGARVLELLERDPRLKAAANQHLSEADIRAAKAAVRLDELRTKGIESKKTLSERLTRGEGDRVKDKADYACVCQMYGAAREIASGKMDLSKSEYGGERSPIDDINRSIAGHWSMASYGPKFPKEKLALMEKPDGMVDTYQRSMEDRQRKLRQEREAQQARNLKKAENDKLMTYKQDRIDGFFANMNTKMGEKMPEPEAGNQSPIRYDREQFAIMCTLACGSSDVSYKASLGQNMETFVYTNEPDVIYPKVMQGKLMNPVDSKKGMGMSQANSTAKAAVRFVTDGLKAAAENGNYAPLAKLLTDGLRQNNKLLQSCTSLDDGYCAYAQFGEKALELINSNEQLKAAAGQYLTQEDLHAVRAAGSIARLRQTGLESRARLLEGTGTAEDLANFSQMCAVGKQINAKSLDLSSSPYGLSGVNMAGEFNKAVSGGAPIRDFFARQSEEQVKALDDMDAMSGIYEAGVNSTLNKQGTGIDAKKPVKDAQNTNEKGNELGGAGAKNTVIVNGG